MEVFQKLKTICVLIGKRARSNGIAGSIIDKVMLRILILEIEYDVIDRLLLVKDLPEITVIVGLYMVGGSAVVAVTHDQLMYTVVISVGHGDTGYICVRAIIAERRGTLDRYLHAVVTLEEYQRLTGICAERIVFIGQITVEGIAVRYIAPVVLTLREVGCTEGNNRIIRRILEEIDRSDLNVLILVVLGYGISLGIYAGVVRLEQLRHLAVDREATHIEAIAICFSRAVTCSICDRCLDDNSLARLCLINLIGLPIAAVGGSARGGGTVRF